MTKIKIHLCGVAVKYESHSGKKGIPSDLPSREQGSLYSWQRRKIADATIWMKRNVEYPLIFCLTSPGYTSLANQSNVLSQFINNARKNYGMGHYVWVRELTKKGFPHFHFIADWKPVEHWFKKENGETNITRMSRYWSGLFDSDATNSIRLGSYHPVTGDRCYYVEHDRQCWYLAKYIGKNIGETSTDYLAEAGFPQMFYKKRVRSFCVSPELARYSAPVEFEPEYETEFVKKKVYTVNGWQEVLWPRHTTRSWASEFGKDTHSFRDSMLLNYRWKDTGHGGTFVGYLRKDADNPI